MPPHRLQRHDVLVIGSGAVGAACASALARAGRKVRVLSSPARSTTAVSGGHLLLQSKQPGPNLELARLSLELLAAFVEGREEELRYRQSGSLLLAASAEEADALHAHYLALAGSGAALEWLSGEAVRRLEPELSDRIAAASYCRSDAQIDPALLAGAWLSDALQHRAAITSGGSVESFVTSGGRICGVVAGGVEYASEAVVLAAGPWSGELAAMAGTRLEIRPRRGVLLRGTAARVLASRPLLGAGYLCSKFSAESPSVAFSFQQHPEPAGTPDPGGACILGGSRSFDDFSTAGVADTAIAIREEATRYLPAAAGVDWEEVTVGFRPWTPTGSPHIGPCQVPGLYLACGHEGDGITLAAGTAERIVACLGD